MPPPSGSLKDFYVHDNLVISGFFEDYRWLSNYHEAEVMFEGMIYPSNENAFQAAKTLDLKDRERFQKMSPKESKKEGKLVNLRPNWDLIKYQIMFDINFDKFMRHPDIQRKLIDTGEKYLIEKNWWKDTIWGVCDGRGSNWMGLILMGVRSAIKLNWETYGFQTELK